MLESLYKHTIFSPKHYCVLEIIYDSRTTYSVNIHEVTRHKKTQFKVKCVLEDKPFTEAIHYLKNNKHIALNIRGKVLLEDQIKLDDDLKNPNQFNLEQHFGFGQIEDYIISTFFTSYHCNVIALRKEIAKEWINKLNKEKVEVFHLSLGWNTLTNYFKGIELKSGIYHIEHQILSWDGTFVETYLGDEKANALIQIIDPDDNGEIEEVGIIALSIIISHYYKFAYPELVLEDQKSLKLKEQEESYFIYQFIKKTGQIILPTLFLGLLINFFAFTHYSEEASKLKESLSTNEFKWKIYEDLKQKFENNKSVLTRNTPLGSLTYYADQIAHLRPYQVSFKKVNIFPLIEKGLEFDIAKNTLFIEGYSANHSQYQAWIKLLNKTDWIEKLETINYKRNAESGLTDFTLKIDIKHE